MPEMPEMEAAARLLDVRLAGGRLARIELGSFTALKTTSPPPTAFAGAAIESVGRRAKILVMTTAAGAIAVHLYRAGWIAWREGSPKTPLRPGKGRIVARLVAETADGPGYLDFTEAGTERRLAMWLAPDTGALPPLAELGPEALELAADEEAFAAALGASRAQLKTWLTDQRILTGVGNAFSDEIAHAARLSPFAPVGSLPPDAVARLAAAVVSVLTGAVAEFENETLTGIKPHKKSSMAVHGREGLPCPVCGDTVRSVNYATSSLQYCPTCQTKGKPLADRRLSRLLK